MLAIVEQLLVVQDRDRRIAQLKSEQARIPQQAAAVDAQVRQESTRLESLRQEFKHVESERKRVEIEAETKRIQITKYRTQLYQIKSNVEYQALLKEIAKVEQEIKEIEDHELDLMEKVEELQHATKEEQALVIEITAKADTEKSEFDRRTAAIAQELSQLQTVRDALAQQTDSEALERYERLMRSKGDMAIVPVRSGNCGGCHLTLAPQLVHDARHGDELISCEYCGRILYWQPE